MFGFQHCYYLRTLIDMKINYETTDYLTCLISVLLFFTIIKTMNDDNDYFEK